MGQAPPGYSGLRPRLRVAAAHPSYPLRVAFASLRLPCARKAPVPPFLPTANCFPTRAPKHARTKTNASPHLPAVPRSPVRTANPARPAYHGDQLSPPTTKTRENQNERKPPSLCRLPVPLCGQRTRPAHPTAASPLLTNATIKTRTKPGTAEEGGLRLFCFSFLLTFAR
jgi:hypothetical protein